jgi:threonine dehydratase
MRLPSLEQIESAGRVVYDALPPTPQYAWPLLAERAGCEVWVKHENHTPTGAFKVRGGLVYMADLARRGDGGCGGLPGVITATRGNHGQSVAFAAARHGIRAVVCVPEGNSVEKNAAMRAFGAELLVHGRDFQEAREYAERMAAEQGLHMLPSYDERLIRGVATYPLELFRAVPDLDTVYVPIGLGSGVSATIAARDALNLTTEVVGVVADGAPAYKLSFEAGRPISTDRSVTIADGMACRVPEPEAVEVLTRGAARVVSLSEDEIRAAMLAYYTDTHNVAEGAGAAPLAACLQERARNRGKKVGVMLCGGNVDASLFREILAEA